MGRFLQAILLATTACSGTLAFADQIGVGLLSYDQISSSQNQFDITNLTGVNSLPPSFPISTTLTLTINSLVVNFSSGPALTLPGSDFTVVDAQGDLDCTAGPCNLFGDSITSAVLTGTLSPTTGLSGLPAGDTGILAPFSTTITPTCSATTLTAGCDRAVINATGTSTTGAPIMPEPGAFSLVGIGGALVGLRLWRRVRGVRN